MNTDAVVHLKAARGSLVRQRNTLTRLIAGVELAPISIADDLTKILLAIEAADRALADAGHPHFDAEH